MKSILVSVLVLGSTALEAQQPDPSTMVFSDGSTARPAKVHKTDAAPLDDGMENSRYVKKPRAHKRKRSTASAEGNQKPSAAPQVPDTGGQAPQVTPLPPLTGENFNNQSVPQPSPVPAADQNPSLGNRVRDIFLGGDLELMDRYRNYLDFEDIRKNIFEFTLATTYMYNSSSSPYFFRNYINSSPGALIGLDLWLTPFLGIDAGYRFSILDSIKDSPTIDNYVTSTHEWFDIGIKFRRFFGMALNSSSLTFGIRYADYRLTVPPSAQTRLVQHTRGAEVTVDLSVPVSRSYFWNFGFSVQPFLSHDEFGTTLDLRSGQGNQTAAFGVNLGGEYRMSRQTRAFFKLSSSVYRTQFSGSSNAVDPVTGMQPSNVPVTNAFYFIDLGVKLGR